MLDSAVTESYIVWGIIPVWLSHSVISWSQCWMWTSPKLLDWEHFWRRVPQNLSLDLVSFVWHASKHILRNVRLPDTVKLVSCKLSNSWFCACTIFLVLSLTSGSILYQGVTVSGSGIASLLEGYYCLELCAELAQPSTAAWQKCLMHVDFKIQHYNVLSFVCS